MFRVHWNVVRSPPVCTKLSVSEFARNCPMDPAPINVFDTSPLI